METICNACISLNWPSNLLEDTLVMKAWVKIKELPDCVQIGKECVEGKMPISVVMGLYNLNA